MVQQEQQAAAQAAAASQAAAAELQQRLDAAWQHQEAAVAAAASAAEAEVAALRQQLEAAQQLQEQLGAGQQQLQQQLESMSAEHQQASAALHACTEGADVTVLREPLPQRAPPCTAWASANLSVCPPASVQLVACLPARLCACLTAPAQRSAFPTFRLPTLPACLPALQEVDLLGEESIKLMDMLTEKQVGARMLSTAGFGHSNTLWPFVQLSRLWPACMHAAVAAVHLGID